MDREDTIELLRSINTKLANLYEHWGAPGWSISSRIAAGKDMTMYMWECCCGEKKEGYIDTNQMMCETCNKVRYTTNRILNGTSVWKLPVEHQGKQTQRHQILQAAENGRKKLREELATKYERQKNETKKKPPPKFRGFKSNRV